MNGPAHRFALLLALMLVPASVSAAEAPASAVLRGHIVDATTLQPVACSIQIQDSRGRIVIESEGYRDGFRCSGTFTKSLPPGPTRVRITRGFEYLAEERTFDLGAAATTEFSVSLRRQVDLRARGWFAQDHHAHMLHGERTLPVTFDDVALAARAEDLSALSLAQAWTVASATPENLERELVPRSTSDCRLSWNLEAPKNYFRGDAARCLGHCWTMGVSGRIPDGIDVIAELLRASAWDYESDKPSFANFESHALIRAQGGIVAYTHPARWWTGAWGGAGGYPRRVSMRISNMAVELPLDVVAGPTFDGLDVITGVGESAADEKAFQLWASLLQNGYRVAATASSDACFDRPGGATPGSARLYAYLDGPFSVSASSRAIAQGRTFATTGPLLLLSVDRRPPGTAVTADGQPHELRLEAWPSGAATGCLDRVELFRNGNLWRSYPVGPASNAWSTGLIVSPTHSEWYCARAFGTDARRQRAVTGAVYFDATPWTSAAPTRARIRARVVAEDTGQPISADLVELRYLGTRGMSVARHRAPEGVRDFEMPATSRLRAEAPGYEPRTLSPFFDHAALVEFVTGLDAEALLDGRTFERVRALIGDVPLTFRLRRPPAR